MSLCVNSPTVNFEHSERSSVPLQDHIHGAPYAVLVGGSGREFASAPMRLHSCCYCTPPMCIDSSTTTRPTSAGRAHYLTPRRCLRLRPRKGGWSSAPLLAISRTAGRSCAHPQCVRAGSKPCGRAPRAGATAEACQAFCLAPSPLEPSANALLNDAALEFGKHAHHVE